MKVFRRLSAPGSSALSIWELEGTHADLEPAFGASLPSVKAPLRLDRDSMPFDEALLWLRKAPHGKLEHMTLECHLHGGHGVASAFRSWLQGFGWEEVQQGREDPLDLLVHASSPLAARVAMPLAGGGFRRTIDALQTLDLPDKERALRDIQQWDPWAEVLASPPTILLAGPANSGKSSLFNLWNEAELVTTHEGAGTTRDPVRSRILLGKGEEQALFHLVDSAGIGEEQESLDLQAMQLTLLQLPLAWRVLWILDHATPPPAVVLDRVQRRRAEDLVILHRTDLEPGWSLGEAGIRPDLEGNIGEGREWVRRIEDRLLQPLGAPPPPGAVVALEEEQRRLVEKLLQDLN